MRFKELVSTVVILAMTVTQVAFADCDFSTGITPGSDKTFVYTEVCHKKVGQLVKDNASKNIQIDDLTKAISLKDIALTDADKRAANWMSTSAELEGRLQKVDTLQRTNQAIYFGLGVLTTFLAVYGAGQLVRR